MPQRHTFHLYSVGEPVRLLTLGSLILDDFENPLLVRHYSHRELSHDEIKNWASVQSIKNPCFSYERGWSPEASLEAMELVNLELGHAVQGERRVVAERGLRVQLNEPETFLLEHVLREPKAQRALMLWLSAARSAYMLKLKWARKPKIWMLTGQYLLDDARTVSISSREETGKVGVTSAAVGALAGVPVGGSIGLGHNSKAQVTMEMPGQNVWAARYHLVDTDFVRLKAGEEAQLPPVIALHPDVTSRAGKAASWYMDTGGQEPEVATVQLEKQSEPKTRVQEVVEVIELPVGEGKAASEPEARVQEMVEVIELPDGEGKTTSENDGRGDYSRDLEEAIQEFEKVMGQGVEEDPDEKTDMVDTTAGGQLY